MAGLGFGAAEKELHPDPYHRALRARLINLAVAAFEPCDTEWILDVEALYHRAAALITKKWNPKVLLVLPRRFQAAALATCLQRFGCVVDIAVTGRAAYTRYLKNNHHEYDLCVVDWGLRDVGARDLIFYNREAGGTLVFLAALPPKVSPADAIRAGASLFLRNPLWIHLHIFREILMPNVKASYGFPRDLLATPAQHLEVRRLLQPVTAPSFAVSTTRELVLQLQREHEEEDCEVEAGQEAVEDIVRQLKAQAAASMAKGSMSSDRAERIHAAFTGCVDTLGSLQAELAAERATVRELTTRHAAANAEVLLLRQELERTKRRGGNTRRGTIRSPPTSPIRGAAVASFVAARSPPSPALHAASRPFSPNDGAHRQDDIVSPLALSPHPPDPDEKPSGNGRTSRVVVPQTPLQAGSPASARSRASSAWSATPGSPRGLGVGAKGRVPPAQQREQLLQQLSQVSEPYEPEPGFELPFSPKEVERMGKHDLAEFVKKACAHIALMGAANGQLQRDVERLTRLRLSVVHLMQEHDIQVTLENALVVTPEQVTPGARVGAMAPRDLADALGVWASYSRAAGLEGPPTPALGPEPTKPEGRETASLSPVRSGSASSYLRPEQRETYVQDAGTMADLEPSVVGLPPSASRHLSAAGSPAADTDGGFASHRAAVSRRSSQPRALSLAPEGAVRDDSPQPHRSSIVSFGQRSPPGAPPLLDAADARSGLLMSPSSGAFARPESGPFRSRESSFVADESRPHSSAPRPSSRPSSRRESALGQSARATSSLTELKALVARSKDRKGRRGSDRVRCEALEGMLMAAYDKEEHNRFTVGAGSDPPTLVARCEPYDLGRRPMAALEMVDVLHNDVALMVQQVAATVNKFLARTLLTAPPLRKRCEVFAKDLQAAVDTVDLAPRFDGLAQEVRDFTARLRSGGSSQLTTPRSGPADDFGARRPSQPLRVATTQAIAAKSMALQQKLHGLRRRVIRVLSGSTDRALLLRFFVRWAAAHGRQSPAPQEQEQGLAGPELQQEPSAASATAAVLSTPQSRRPSVADTLNRNASVSVDTPAMTLLRSAAREKDRIIEALRDELTKLRSGSPTVTGNKSVQTITFSPSGPRPSQASGLASILASSTAGSVPAVEGIGVGGASVTSSRDGRGPGGSQVEGNVLSVRGQGSPLSLSRSGTDDARPPLFAGGTDAEAAAPLAPSRSAPHGGRRDPSNTGKARRNRVASSPSTAVAGQQAAHSAEPMEDPLALTARSDRPQTQGHPHPGDAPSDRPPTQGRKPQGRVGQRAPRRSSVGARPATHSGARQPLTERTATRAPDGGPGAKPLPPVTARATYRRASNPAPPPPRLPADDALPPLGDSPPPEAVEAPAAVQSGETPGSAQGNQAVLVEAHTDYASQLGITADPAAAPAPMLSNSYSGRRAREADVALSLNVRPLQAPDEPDAARSVGRSPAKEPPLTATPRTRRPVHPPLRQAPLVAIGAASLDPPTVGARSPLLQGYALSRGAQRPAQAPATPRRDPPSPPRSPQRSHHPAAALLGRNRQGRGVSPDTMRRLQQEMRGVRALSSRGMRRR